MGVQRKEIKTHQYMNIAFYLPEAHHSSNRIIKYFRRVCYHRIRTKDSLFPLPVFLYIAMMHCIPSVNCFEVRFSVRYGEIVLCQPLASKLTWTYVCAHFSPHKNKHVNMYTYTHTYK